MGDVFMIGGEIVHGFVNHAKDQGFDNTGTDLTSTNAEDAIKEVNSNLSQNNFGAYTDISSYVTAANKFTCPSDGYLYLVVTDTTSYASMVVQGANENLTPNMCVAKDYQAQLLFVKKGMKAYIGTTSGNYGALFIPLT